MTQREIQHLYLRAGFGADASLINRSLGLGRKAVLDRLFADSTYPTELNAIRMPTADEIAMANSKDKTPEGKKKIREYFKEEDRKMNLAWLKRMMSGTEALNEKMTFFWHDHFACKDENSIHAQSLNNTIRKYALGDFRQMCLLAVSKEPAMLKYLNNQQNKKNAPNENFAREVMELFTLGRGNYTEADIKNGARAFTGWGFDKETMNYEFREKQHDYGEKTFLGATGTFNGEEVLRLITEQRQCAAFITDKIYRYFVNEKGNDERVAGLAAEFYKDYNIGGLMRNIFSADWFYDEENIGVRIKSPVELMASLGRHFDPTFPHENILLLVQRVLGQLLFNPPNVSGWPNGKEWIDSSSLIFRTNLGRKIIEASEIDTTPKPDDDKNPNEMMKKEKRFELIEARIDWEKMVKEFNSSKDEELIAKVGAYLLQIDVPKGIATKIKMEGLTAEQKMKRICAALTSLPEYQLC